MDGVGAGPVLKVNTAFRQLLLHRGDELVYEDDDVQGTAGVVLAGMINAARINPTFPTERSKPPESP